MRKKYIVKLIYRLILLAAAAVVYFTNGDMLNPNGNQCSGLVLGGVWISIMADYIFRIIPNKKLSIGCQKEFAYKYAETEYNLCNLKKQKRQQDIRAAVLLGVWILAHTFIWGLYFLKYIEEKELIMLMLLYHLGDMVCILYWCPFRTIFMRNRCCATCRIFGWDAFFLITPIMALPGIMTTSLVITGIFITLRWEYVYHKHPERFFEASNKALRCSECTERLCTGRNRFESRVRKLFKI